MWANSFSILNSFYISVKKSSEVFLFLLWICWNCFFKNSEDSGASKIARLNDKYITAKYWSKLYTCMYYIMCAFFDPNFLSKLSLYKSQRQSIANTKGRPTQNYSLQALLSKCWQKFKINKGGIFEYKRKSLWFLWWNVIKYTFLL